MELVKKVEIITNSLELDKVLNLLENVGVSGYTVIKDVTGFGDRGKVINDFDSSALTNGYVMSICTETQEEKVVETIRPILKKYGGVCIVSDAKWIVH